MKLGLVLVGGLSRDPSDGSIPAIQWLVERLARRHEVHAFTLFGARRPDRYPLLGATVHHAGSRGRAWRTLSAIIGEHRRGSFDVLHAFWLVPGGAIAAAAARITGRPLLGHIGGGELAGIPDANFGHQLYWKGRLWARFAIGSCAVVTGASDGVVKDLARRGARAERVPLGVALDHWPAVAPRPRTPGRPARLIQVATLNRVKDQPTLIRAARRLLDAGVNFTLDIAGPDTLGGEIQALVERMGLSSRVRFMGYLPHDRLHALVAQADLMLHTSRYETGPLSVLEAAVVGVPAVGTAVGHVAEWVPLAAVAVPVGDDDALARETLALLGDESRRMRMAAEAQRRALAQDADWTATRFEELYREVTAARR